jgi:hypothetical protein
MRPPKLASLVLALACVASASCGGTSGGGSTVATTDAAEDTLVSASDASDPSDVAVGDTSGTDTATTSDAPSDAVALGPYPGGPYGTNEGDVLADLQWEGYVDELGDAPAKSKPYGTTSMSAIRSTGRRYALVHLAEFL